MVNQQASKDCYDYPRYWDLAFQGETQLEADFIAAACQKYCDFEVGRLCEPGCGGGRLVVELSRRGFQIAAFDTSRSAVDFTQERLSQAGLQASLQVADMRDFKLTKPVDAAYNTMNTFRHLLSEQDAIAHLELMAKFIRPGGIYILGFHLLPPDADLEDSERWTEQEGETRVTLTLRVLEASRRKRLETIRFNLRVHDGDLDLKLRTDYTLRMYTARQVKQLFRAVPAFELCDVYDFWYEIDEPLKLNDELGDCVFILRRRP